MKGMKSVVAAGIGVAALVVASSGPAFGGEITGKGKPTQGPAHAHSICAFSGLEDGNGAGFPGPGGAPPQNWGHSKDAFGSPQEAKTSGFQPGDSCNGHYGFLVNPPPETTCSTGAR